MNDLSPPHIVPVTDAVRLLAREIEHLRDRLETLEHGVERIYQRTEGGLCATTLTALQEIDMLVQATAALGGFAERLADAAPTTPVADIRPALNSIALRDIADRLGGRATTSDRPKSAAQEGRAELF